jgi:hypothetical protein
MELAKVERYVSDLMTVSGVEKEGREQNVGLALYHLLMSASLHDLMSDDEKDLFKALTKKLQFFFCTRLSLKERKRNKEKKIIPPNPLLKEKENKEEDEKTLSLVEHGFSAADEGVDNGDSSAGKRLKGHSHLSATLPQRREAFRQECAQFVERYDRQQLADFFNYWSQENPSTGKMRFEEQRWWNLNRRLPRWMNNKYSADNVAAAIRLKRTQKKQQQELTDAKQQQAQAAVREADNQRREQEAEESRKDRVMTDEYLKNNPGSNLAKILGEPSEQQAEPNKKGGAP